MMSGVKVHVLKIEANCHYSEIVMEAAIPMSRIAPERVAHAYVARVT